MKHSVSDQEKLLDIAGKAACKSGKFLLQSNKKSKNVRLNSKRDVKISADTQSEEIIVDFLRSKSRFSILTEEKGLLGEKTENDPVWIVDPLDGSVNFLKGIPLNCISIGLWEGEKPLLGVIYDFNKDELFSGIAGKAAWLNQKRIKVTGVAREEEAVLCTGFPMSTNFSSEALSTFIKQIQNYKKIRLFGSAALSLAYVAVGRADAYYERDIMIWDVAAGLAIVEGAGGKIQLRPSVKENAFVVYASNPYINIT